MTEEKPLGEVRINVENREGTVYVSSDEVPGLWLWGTDPELVLRNLVPAIQSLFKHNRHTEVRVQEKEPRRRERWSEIDRIPREFLIYRVTTDPKLPEGTGGRQALE